MMTRTAPQQQKRMNEEGSKGIFIIQLIVLLTINIMIIFVVVIIIAVSMAEEEEKVK